jgi:hypothetical protein
LGWSPSATTVSDVNGKYFLCGVTSSLGIALYASKPGWIAAVVSADANGGGTLDIELARKQ